MNQFHRQGNQRGGGKFGFKPKKPNNQDKSSGSGGRHQMGGKRKNDPENQGRIGQFGEHKQVRRNFERWPLYNKCKRRHLGDCNDSPKCFNCGKLGHLARDCQNCYNCRKPGHFARECPELGKSDQKQGNARVYALT